MNLHNRIIKFYFQNDILWQVAPLFLSSALVGSVQAMAKGNTGKTRQGSWVLPGKEDTTINYDE